MPYIFRDIIRRRRQHEYSLQKRNKRITDFDSYIATELGILKLIYMRRNKTSDYRFTDKIEKSIISRLVRLHRVCILLYFRFWMCNVVANLYCYKFFSKFATDSSPGWTYGCVLFGSTVSWAAICPSFDCGTVSCRFMDALTPASGHLQPLFIWMRVQVPRLAVLSPNWRQSSELSQRPRNGWPNWKSRPVAPPRVQHLVSL